MSKEIICSLNEQLSLKRCFERLLQTSLRTTIRTSSQDKTSSVETHLQHSYMRETNVKVYYSMHKGTLNKRADRIVLPNLVAHLRTVIWNKLETVWRIVHCLTDSHVVRLVILCEWLRIIAWVCTIFSKVNAQRDRVCDRNHNCYLSNCPVQRNIRYNRCT